jgi:hypothetical protein
MEELTENQGNWTLLSECFSFDSFYFNVFTVHVNCNFSIPTLNMGQAGLGTEQPPGTSFFNYLDK